MTDIPATLSGAECHGDRPPEDSQQRTSKLDEETTVVRGTLPSCRVEPDLEDSFTTGQQEENGKPQRNTLSRQPLGEKILNENPEENVFVVHKAVTDLSLQETSTEEEAFRAGNQWEKIPVSSGNQEVSRSMQKMAHQPLEEREDENKAYQATAIEWLGFRKPSQVDLLHSKHEEEQEVWEEDIDEDDIDDCNNDEDEVRVIELKKKPEEGSQLKEADEASEDSPLSSPSSQPATPDEPLTLGKKGDISRSTYSRYNTISYRKIRKGNTKQRIDEFESMMHL